MAQDTPWPMVFERVIEVAIERFGGYHPDDGIHPNTPDEFRRKLVLAQQSSGVYGRRLVRSREGMKYFNTNNAELVALHDNLLKEKLKTHYWYTQEGEASEWRAKMLDEVHTQMQVDAAERQHERQEGI